MSHLSHIVRQQYLRRYTAGHSRYVSRSNATSIRTNGTLYKGMSDSSIDERRKGTHQRCNALKGKGKEHASANGIAREGKTTSLSPAKIVSHEDDQGGVPIGVYWCIAPSINLQEIMRVSKWSLPIDMTNRN